MAHAWWRDSDYKLFDRLTRERDAARAALKEVAARQREACSEHLVSLVSGPTVKAPVEVGKFIHVVEASEEVLKTPLVTEGVK
jgi:hypothetical protein